MADMVTLMVRILCFTEHLKRDFILRVAAIGYLTDMWSFNTSRKTWSFLGGSGTNLVGNYLPASSQPGGRMSMAATLDSTNRLLYMFGGFGLSGIATSSLFLGKQIQNH